MALLDDPTGWFLGFISAALIKTKLTDPINAFAASTADSGNLSTGLGVGAATGWGSVAYTFRTFGPICYLTIAATRTGANITASATGTLVDVPVALLTDHIPSVLQWGYFVSPASGGGCFLDTSGNWTITDAHSGSTIATSDVVRASFGYPL